MSNKTHGWFGNIANVSGLCATLSVALLSTASASAAPSAGPDLDKWRHVERFEVKTPYSSTNAGAARVNVDAPVDTVRAVVQDFKNYSAFIPRFEKSHVVGRSGDKTDVYLQVPILKGAAKVWAIVRFDPPKQVGEEEQVVGHMVKGNVKRLDAVWHMKKIDDTSTKLSLDLLIVPDLPVPDALVVPEVRFAADKAVGGSRDEAEKRRPHAE
ncbi:MAG TPA: SRPBCC family protein [Polyangiaceae bacterium]|jgi:ribosome-associated toxin RatA of RatAB toxin-antitoxin module